MRSIVLFFIIITSLFPKNLDLSFIALDKEDWKIIVCKNDICKTVDTEQEPRTYDYDFENGNIIYIASDKSVKLISNEKEVRILESKTDAYTEPLFINDGKNIMLVKLINGNSTKTKIITIDLEGKSYKTIHSQHSTALEPYTKDNESIYYANVSCVEGCGKIIQEIWYKDRLSGEAKQLTLLNVLSHQPSVDSQKEFVYFSSNKYGAYHIWSYAFKDGSTERLTMGDVTDGSPIPYDKGILFLRRTGNQVKLMQIDKNGNITKVKLPHIYQKIRNLKVKQ